MVNSVTLSIIIPAYNCAGTIEKTIASVLRQKCSDYEIVIVNDGSKDGTVQICEELSRKHDFIKYICKENTGVADTRNSGIINASGRYVAFLDSDDLWDENYYDAELNAKLQNKDADIWVFSSCFADLEGNPTQVVRVRTEELFGGDYAAGLYYHSFCSFIFRKEFLTDNDVFFPTKLKYGEDEVFRSKALYLADQICAEDKISFYYIDNPYSSTKMNRNYKHYALQKLQAYRELKGFFFSQYRARGEDVGVKNNITARYLTESFRLLPEVGFGYHRFKVLCREEDVEGLLSRDGQGYRIGKEAQPAIQGYLRHPLIYYAKRRTYGLVHNTLGNIKHIAMRRLHHG